VNIVLIGAPGSGKGTQSAYIVEKYGLHHVSTGEMLREYAQQDNELARRLNAMMSEGRLIPDDLMNELLTDKIIRMEVKNGFLFDGFPRTPQQASDLETLLQRVQQDLTCAIMIDVERSVIEKRLTGRFSCNSCKTTYNVYFKPTEQEGVCDVCGGCMFDRRDDDDVVAVKMRIEKYQEQSDRLCAHYEGLNKLSCVDGMQQATEVAKSISHILEGER